MIVGGAQENTLFNCLDLQQIWQDEVLLITGPSPGPEGELLGQGREGGLNIKVLPDLQRAIHPWRDLRAYRSIKQTLKEFQPDVVHTHSAKGGILGRQAAWALGVDAIVHTVHGAPFHAYQSVPVRSFYRWCERRAAQQCHRLVCVADAMKDLLVDAGVAPATQCVTVYSGMDVEPFLQAKAARASLRQQLGLTDQHVVVGKVARLFDLKGHDDLIAAAKPVTQAHPEVRFLLVGDGMLRQQLQDRVAALGLKEHFIFAGLVPPEAVAKYIGAMDLLVHCSLREGLARALPQALIAGKPVISYDIDGAREVVTTDQTGILLAPRDIQGLTAAINRLISDEELRVRLGSTGRDLCQEKFRHENMTRDLRRLYMEILAENRRGR
jgi:glycosyltransferase involved in cell wall biosynthesis